MIKVKKKQYFVTVLQWLLYSDDEGGANLSLTWDPPIAIHNHPINSQWTKSSLPNICSCLRSQENVTIGKKENTVSCQVNFDFFSVKLYALYILISGKFLYTDVYWQWTFTSAKSPAPWALVQIGFSKASQRELSAFLIPLNGIK